MNSPAHGLQEGGASEAVASFDPQTPGDPMFALLSIALAASLTHQNRCDDAVRELRGVSRLYEDRDVSPAEVTTVNAHLAQVAERFQRARKMLDSAGTWSPDDPQLAACVTMLRDTRSYVAATGAKLDAATALAGTGAPVLAAGDNPEARKALVGIVAHVYDARIDMFRSMSPASARARIDSLRPVAAACTKAGLAPTAPPPLPRAKAGTPTYEIGTATFPATLAEDANWWCWASAHAQEHAVAALTNVNAIADGYGNHEVIFQQVRAPGWGGSAPAWLFDIASDPAPFARGLQAARASWYQAFGAPVPAGADPALTAEVAEVRAAVVAYAQAHPFAPAAMHDNAKEAAARKLISTWHPTATVLASWMETGDWGVEVDVFGVPLRRWRTGSVAYRVGADPFCRLQMFTWEEPYLGGAFQAPKAPTFEEYVTAAGCVGG